MAEERPEPIETPPVEADPELLVDIEITNPDQADKLLPPGIKRLLAKEE